MRGAVVDLRHDREDRHLEHDRVQPRTLDRDVDVAAAVSAGRDPDEPLVELEELEEVDVVALEEAPAAQVFELVAAKAQAAQLPDAVLDRTDVRSKVDARIAALEAILD